MPKIYQVQHSFNAGELSELVSGFRDDVQKYNSGCEILENSLPLIEGAAKKMPGTYFAGTTANGGAMFTGSISGTVLAVTAVNYGVIQVGQTVVGAGVAAGTVVSAYGTGTGVVGNYTITPSQTVASETMQTESSGKSRIVPFQFSTIQGAILEFSAGIIRIWEGSTQGDWALGTVLQASSGVKNYQATGTGGPPYTVAGVTVPVSGGGRYKTASAPDITFSGPGAGGASASPYMEFRISYWTVSSVTIDAGGSYTGPVSVTFSGGDPINDHQAAGTVLLSSSGITPTVYIPGNTVSVGPTAFISSYGGVPAGNLFIAAPYGTSNASTVPITFSVNASDALSVTKTGTSPVQGINIALANTTASKNAASLIQTAIQALVSLNSSGNNFVDLSAWTCTPDTVYYATPWITAPVLAPFSSNFLCVNQNYVCLCVLSNQYDQFPLSSPGVFNSTYWENAYAVSPLPVELVTPYLETDLFELDCSTQSADVLWVFHPNYPPAVIERLSAGSWQYSLSLPGGKPGEPAYRGTLDVVKTGYSALGQNISLISQSNPCTIVLAGSSSTQPFSVGDRIYINLGSGLVELNEGEFFVASISYGSVSIQVVNSSGTPSTVTATGWHMTLNDPDTGITIDSTSYLQYLGGAFAVKIVPMFSAAGDYPSCGTLYQERLIVGGSNNNPTQINGSVEDDYPDFIADPNMDDYAIQYTLVSNQVNQLLNMIGTPNALLAGTSGGVWVIQGGSGSSAALSQTNVSAVIQSSLGVSKLQPQLVNGSGIFVSRSTRIVTFLLYNFVSNTWDNIDLTRLNRNITIGDSPENSGICQTAFQMEPYPIFWSVRNDGQLLGLVFNTQDQVFGWFRVNMIPEGGYIESIAVITGSGQEDELVAVVRRTINGVTQRYVEYFMPQEMFDELSNAFFVHCGQQLQGVGPFAITGITNSNPPVVTAPGHTLMDGMTVQITQVNGMVSATGQTINQDSTEAYTVTGVVGGTFELQGMDTTTWTPYVSGGSVSQVFNQVSGMSYLIGNNVTAVGDGAVILQPTEVTSDMVTFPYYSNLITIGIPYAMTVQPTNPVFSNQALTSRGMPQKLNRVTLSLYHAMGGQYGEDSDHLYDINYGPGAEASIPQMSTAEFTRDMDCDWTEESTFLVKQSEPLPFTLRGVVFRMTANPD